MTIEGRPQAFVSSAALREFRRRSSSRTGGCRRSRRAGPPDRRCPGSRHPDASRQAGIAGSVATAVQLIPLGPPSVKRAHLDRRRRPCGPTPAPRPGQRLPAPTNRPRAPSGIRSYRSIMLFVSCMPPILFPKHCLISVSIVGVSSIVVALCPLSNANK
jgi:hypothetical protein